MVVVVVVEAVVAVAVTAVVVLAVVTREPSSCMHDAGRTRVWMVKVERSEDLSSQRERRRKQRDATGGGSKGAQFVSDLQSAVFRRKINEVRFGFLCVFILLRRVTALSCVVGLVRRPAHRAHDCSAQPLAGDGRARVRQKTPHARVWVIVPPVTGVSWQTNQMSRTHTYTHTHTHRQTHKHTHTHTHTENTRVRYTHVHLRPLCL